MRNLVEVIDQMLAVVPICHVEFIAALNSAKQSAIMSAPELMWLRWQTVSECLTDYIHHEYDVDWQRQVIEIWTTKPLP